mmetsp:Transcript_3643/g.4793  ORF Transcript_3643/g.4793 Transcript_3643/m.4793 type:complete len:114 (-) Transcript_3643:894-1235(-)
MNSLNFLPSNAYSTNHKQGNITEKEKIKCPFAINFSYVKKKPGVAMSSLHVKITKVNTLHTCTLSSASHRVALRKSGQLVKLDLNHMQTVMELLREKPHTASRELRPLLVKCT